MRRELEEELRPEDRVPYVLPNDYSPLCYLAPAAALRLVEAFGAPPIALLYAGRAASLALTILVVWAAIRLAPAHRFVLLLLGLMPMTMFQAAGLTAEGFQPDQRAGSLLLQAVMLRECASAEALSGRRALWLGVLAAAVGVTKQVYWPLVASAAAIPARRFASPGRRAGILAAIAAGASSPSRSGGRRCSGGPVFLTPGVDPPAQLARIVADPLAFLRLLLATVPLLPSLRGALRGRPRPPRYAASRAALPAVSGGAARGRVPRRRRALAGARRGARDLARAAALGTLSILLRGLRGDEPRRLARHHGRARPLLHSARAVRAGRAALGPRGGLPRSAGWWVAGFAAASLAVTAMCLVSRYYTL